MSGRGGAINTTWDGFVLLESQPNPNVFCLNVKLGFEEGHEPLHKDIDVGKTCGIGPGLIFANALLAKDPSLGPVQLVPCAIGGTSKKAWERGGKIYNQTVVRAKAALQDGGTLRVLLWYQGESDALNKEDADIYKGRLERFFQDLRSDLNSPMLPIIQVALASGEGYTEKVREAQLGIDMANVKCVDAKGVELEPGKFHLTTSSQVRHGKMLADEFFRNLANPNRSHAPKRHQFLFFNILYKRDTQPFRFSVGHVNMPCFVTFSDVFKSEAQRQTRQGNRK